MLAKIKKNYFLILSIFFILYFLISFLGGERGFFSYLKKHNYLESLKKEEAESSLRISLGRMTTINEVFESCERISFAVYKLYQKGWVNRWSR